MSGRPHHEVSARGGLAFFLHRHRRAMTIWTATLIAASATAMLSVLIFG
ncbi:hypothetical protein [Brevundimonas subvibrioides]|uniref:Uncharacterized protein n=1 Tax=Brevundimonas subvibrioides (strain ATCC 15264 / DSM 4735 / LMG 14903 / NBRC 16000 / CB 81) TaxID=633149 RepID=D9QLS5_BRESC|nr:hypothetical protein [Brevundimonas subvibrioides]ADL00009.1 hypothetical protein Bresu_0694 [Brevundimonas subvibrioides ATCC 15264]